MGYINGIKGKEVQVIKKILFLTMALILGVLAGCTENVPEIDGFEWKMESVQQGSDGRYIFCSPEMSDIFENVEIADVECVASDGKITVINNADGKVCEGNYRIISSDAKSEIYEIIFGEKTGYAVCATTEYDDGTRKPTFVMNIGEMTVNFSPGTDL